jgi:hypothetical protein
MKVLRTLAASVLLTFAGSGAFAQNIDDDTKCGTLVTFTQDSSSGETKAKEAARYIEETMRALDRLHAQRGKVEIIPHMTEEGRSSLVQAVVNRCHERQAITVADIAIETYEAVRAAGAGLGLKRTSQVPARTRYSQTATPRQLSDAGAGSQDVWHEL